MINIDDRLLSYVDSNELFFLMHLAKRINPRDKSCWPSNKTLCKDTKWNIDKVQKVKKALMDRGLLVVERRKDNSNVYRIKTTHIGYYVNASDAEFEEKEGVPENPVEGSTGFNHPHYTGKSGNEVLTTEVLTNKDVAGATNGLPFYPAGFKIPKKKDKKPVDPAYAVCVDIWLKEIHPGWLFGGQQGKAMKSLIKKLRSSVIESLKNEGEAMIWEASEEYISGLFRAMCQNLPAWFKDKDLSVIDQKFNEIITQIQHGETGQQKATGGDWINDLYNRAGKG